MGEPEEIGGLLLNGLSQAVAVYNVVAMDIPASPSQEFAAFCFAAAVWCELYPGTPPPRPDVRRLPRAPLFALNGFLAPVALAALLVGVWFGRRRQLATAVGPRRRLQVR